MQTDPRVDAYIARQADFARPILEHLRALVHAACPDGVETLKWGMPYFTYRGILLAGMSAFRTHAAFGFWRGSQIVGEGGAQGEGMGQFGRLRSVEDLPPQAELEAMVRKAMELAESGVRPPRATKPKAPLAVPQDMRAALDANAAAAATFDGFPPGAQRDYVDWIGGAKRDETRTKRLALAVEWLAEGKRRHWKYENC
ncbi:YdeI/OmpD-associated family protein [Sphingosinicella terrae]|uniref:YdeI/OmpD-associated family protein n=1 Tax=Sphingosinicella terrae TaxID=2172047 RepID=UPI000E0D87A4|nr:YdeI/OmpD-associated family protein [Sphingosinicella terrae]